MLVRISTTAAFACLVEPSLSQQTEREGYVRVDAVNPARVPNPGRVKTWQIDPDVLRVFYGDAIVQFRHAEFRKIVPVFIAFEGVTDINAFATLVLRELRTYGGTISRLDFGDKGGNVLCFFGVPILYENMPTRAMQFILSITEQVEAGTTLHNRLRDR